MSRPRLRRKRVRRGQRLDLRYGLSEGALTRVVVERASRGRRVRRHGCVAATPGRRVKRRRRRCTLWEAVGKAARRDDAGRNRIRIRTRERARGVGRKRRRGRAYPPGAYRLSVSAVDQFRNSSAEQRLRLKIRRPGRGGKRKR